MSIRTKILPTSESSSIVVCRDDEVVLESIARDSSREDGRVGLLQLVDLQSKSSWSVTSDLAHRLEIVLTIMEAVARQRVYSTKAAGEAQGGGRRRGVQEEGREGAICRLARSKLRTFTASRQQSFSKTV